MFASKKIPCIALLSLAFLVPVHPALAQRGGFRDFAASRNNPDFLHAFREAMADASKGTVRVLCDGKESALGTIIEADGWILTKFSLLSGKVTCKLKDGSTFDAKTIGVHEAYDLALLKIEAKDLIPVRLVESKIAAVGNWLISVGTGEDPVSVGVLSVATRTPPPSEFRRGPAPDRLPPNYDYLGIRVTSEGPAAKVVNVFPQSAAGKAGLKVDDKILSVQGTTVSDQTSLLGVLSKMKPGDLATLKVLRDGKELELKATLEQRRNPMRRDQNSMGSELSERRTGFPSFFQSDTVIKPKDCGGPVCDLDGHVLGINIARAGRVESYAIPTEAIVPLLPDLKSGKLSPKILIATTLDKKLAELKAILKKAEEDKAAMDKKFKEAQEAIKKAETDRLAAERKLKDTKDAIEKAEKELKENNK